MIEFPLEFPVKLTEDTTIEVIKLREEMVFGDWMGIPVRELLHWDDVFVLAGRLSGQPDVVLKKLRFPDQRRLAEVIHAFLSPTGAKSFQSDKPSEQSEKTGEGQ